MGVFGRTDDEMNGKPAIKTQLNGLSDGDASEMWTSVGGSQSQSGSASEPVSRARTPVSGTASPRTKEGVAAGSRTSVPVPVSVLEVEEESRQVDTPDEEPVQPVEPAGPDESVGDESVETKDDAVGDEDLAGDLDPLGIGDVKDMAPQSRQRRREQLEMLMK